MALNNQNKRSSAIHVLCPWRSSYPIPDSDLDSGDRAHTAYMFSGAFAVSAVVSAVTVRFSGVTFERGLSRKIKAVSESQGVTIIKPVSRFTEETV